MQSYTSPMTSSATSPPTYLTQTSLDPDFYKKKHAAVWQKIRVERHSHNITMAFEDCTMEDVLNDCNYFVYIRDRPADDATIFGFEFGYDDLSGEFDNVEVTYELQDDGGSYEYTEWHNWAGQDKLQYEGGSYEYTEWHNWVGQDELQ